MDFSHPLLISVRRIGRQLRILQPLQRLFIGRGDFGYEDNFHRAIMSRVRVGDVIWDVGANVGHYTRILAEIVGASGHVVAFEPSPRTFEKLSAEMHARNVTLVNVALSDVNGHADFYVGEACNPTDSLSAAGFDNPSHVVQIAVTTGDDYITRHPNLVPSGIKIDVEGFEYEVLLGLRELLRSPTLKNLFIEVHFEILEARGRSTEPLRIKDILEENGFTICWTDPSHVCAVK